jgi:uncharacterized membrane protein YdjX (TVP38/TMEM64 family)
MNRVLLISLVLFGVFLAVFGLATALGLDLEQVDQQLGNFPVWVAILVALGLLIADVVLPVPSSLIMIANGALFGLPMGALISLMGGFGASLVGYWLGRTGSPRLQKWIPPSDLERGHRFFERWGSLSVIVSRPIPLISETVAVAAGICKLSFPKMAIYSLAGSLPAAILYAWAGANMKGDALGLIPLAAVLGVALLMFLLNRWMVQSQAR